MSEPLAFNPSKERMSTLHWPLAPDKTVLVSLPVGMGNREWDLLEAYLRLTRQAWCEHKEETTEGAIELTPEQRASLTTKATHIP